MAWIGCGSIGFAAVHALDGIHRLTGPLHLVDPSGINRSNLRKYIGLSGGERGKGKADVLARLLHTRGINAKSYTRSINDYGHEVRFDIPMAICSTDTSIARRDLQAKLPRVVLNAWTGGSDDALFAGASRHLFDGIGECLNCAYWNDVEGALNLVDVAMPIGTDSRSLYRRRREGREFPPQTKHVPDRDQRFLDGFFNACDKLPVKPGSVQRDFSIPFIAAIAGALLASSIAAEGCPEGADQRLNGTRLRFAMAHSFSSVYSEPAAARAGCICRDPTYQAVFHQKWAIGAIPGV